MGRWDMGRWDHETCACLRLDFLKLRLVCDLLFVICDLMLLLVIGDLMEERCILRSDD